MVFCHDGRSELFVSLPARYWVDFPYETESICIRHGGTTPRTFPPPPPLKKQSKKSKKSKKKKPKEVINVSLILLVAVTIELIPFRFQASISVNDPFILTKVSFLNDGA